MNKLIQILVFFDKHPVVALFAAWIIYRLGPWNERKNTLRSLDTELSIHKEWMGTPYSTINDISDFSDIRRQVFKLSTTAIDNAISKGSGLFLNTSLTNSLIEYKQLVYNFNQTVDSSNALRSSPELWDGKDPNIPDTPLKKRVIEVMKLIHTKGIGNTSNQAGHAYFLKLTEEITNEKQTFILLWLWFLLGVNLFWLKKYIMRII